LAAGTVVDLFGVDEDQFNPRIIGDPAVVKGFVKALVGFRKIDVFTDNGDLDDVLRGFVPPYEIFPSLEPR
jgi:hypothetical protein